MAAPSGVSSGVGFRNVMILALDANGIITTNGTLPYSGVQVSGAKALTLNDPEPRQIVHTGDDSVFALDTLPPQEPMSGELRVGKQSEAIDALISGVNSVTVGEAKLFPVGTNKRGDEAQVCLLAYRQALDTDETSATYGKRVWQLRLFPRCFVIPREVGFEDAPEERSYTIRPAFINQYPWGVVFTTTTEGAVRSQGLRGVAEYKPKLVAFTANNTATTFTLPVAAAAVGKIKSWLVSTAGVGAVSTATTVGTASLAYTTAPTTGTLVVWYETN